MCIACWIIKAADLHYVILIAFNGYSGFMNALQCYVIRTLPVAIDSKELTEGITCYSFYCFYCYYLVFLCEKTVFLKEAFENLRWFCYNCRGVLVLTLNSLYNCSLNFKNDFGSASDIFLQILSCLALQSVSWQCSNSVLAVKLHSSSANSL